MSYRSFPVRLVGGRLCLDFLNTADWSATGSVVHEKLADAQDLSIWCEAAGLVPGTKLSDETDIEDVRRLRTSLRRLFLATMRGETPKRSDLARLNQTLTCPVDKPLLGQRRGRLAFVKDTPLERVIGLSAVSVLTSQQELARVELCPAEDCGWLFLDESKNRRRRWCSMETCGNRAKARRHYQRHASGGSARAGR